MKVNVIAAVAANDAIGRDNALLWHLRADMQFFKETTMGHPVIMGRRTFESFPRPLPGRLNIVVSRSQLQLPSGAVPVRSLQEAFQTAAGQDELCYVIGGAQIYAQALPFADILLITRVLYSPEGADTFFPEIKESEWRLASSTPTRMDESSGLEYRFEKYVKV